MGNTDNAANTSWNKIQQGVKEVERLIGQKEYNVAMIKARQTLEFMVKCLGERACIIDSDLIDTIDELFKNDYISKTTMEHYHQIRILGNKAVHEGDNTAYNANNAYHMLSQEVYTFANDYSGMRKHAPAKNKSANVRSRRKPAKKKTGPADLLKFLIPILGIVLLIVIIKAVAGNSKDGGLTTVAEPSSSVEATMAESETTAAETEAETAAPVYKTTDIVNVRLSPSTDGEKCAVLNVGVTVNYVKDYDDKWVQITYEGHDAYVSKEFIAKE